VLNVAAGLTRPTSGQVLLEGVDLWTRSDVEQSRLRNERIGFVFQFPSLLPSLTTLENVLLPAAFGSSNHAREAKAGMGERARELLDLVGLSDKLDARPRQLSKGQQQRVVIARSLVNQPDILIADEPTSDLDEQTEREIMDLLQGIHRETRITILLVTHAPQLVSYGTRSIVMSAGKIASDARVGVS
jgi:ABC-type lipoprotein export system ATPase subunit